MQYRDTIQQQHTVVYSSILWYTAAAYCGIQQQHTVVYSSLLWYTVYLAVEEPESQDEVSHDAVQLHLWSVPLAGGLIHSERKGKTTRL